jgi:hypothetical protein
MFVGQFEAQLHHINPNLQRFLLRQFALQIFQIWPAHFKYLSFRLKGMMLTFLMHFDLVHLVYLA